MFRLRKPPIRERQRLMRTYTFQAIEKSDGARVIDHYKLDAMTFAEACYIAQENEINEAFEADREPALYNEFKETNEH